MLPCRGLCIPFVSVQNAGRQTLLITGITAGEGDEAMQVLTLAASSTNESVVGDIVSVQLLLLLSC